jgi:hypothetical protein
MIKAMDVIQTFPNGTTIELGEDGHGNQVHRVCNATGSMCRYVEPYHCAAVYAQHFEEHYCPKSTVEG